jgi:hypothetical protein
MKMAVLLNHTMNNEQILQAQTELGVDSFVLPRENVTKKWSDADPCADLAHLGIEIITEWLSSETSRGDYILVQGDYGLTFAVVDWCLRKGLIPVHATTQQCVMESMERDTKVVKREFRHVKFRKYERIQNGALNS